MNNFFDILKHRVMLDLLNKRSYGLIKQQNNSIINNEDTNRDAKAIMSNEEYDEYMQYTQANKEKLLEHCGNNKNTDYKVVPKDKKYVSGIGLVQQTM